MIILSDICFGNGWCAAYCRHGVNDLYGFITEIGDYDCVISDTAASAMYRTYNTYNFTQPLYGRGHRR